MENWIEYKIGELCEVGRGSSPRPIIDQRYFVDGDIPWIKIADATASGKYIYETKEYVNEFGASFSRHLEPNSLIISASGSIGLIKFLGVKGCIHDGWLYVSNYNENFIDKEYLYYFLIYYSVQFNNYSSGAAIQNINTEILRNTKIKLPSIPIQQKIASILSSYDELIENNKKRIKLLEEMADEIYNEWFVRLRFPGYESTKIVDGLPEGWKNLKIGDICTVGRGSSPRPITDFSFFENGNIPWIKIADATASSKFVLETKEYVNEYGASFSRYLDEGSLIIATSGTLGFCVFLGIKGCIHDGWLYTNSYKMNIKPSYLYYRINSLTEYFNNFSYGAAIQNINTDILRKTSILIPTEDILNNFYSIIDSIVLEHKLLLQKTKLVQESFDLLLPRLISGKLKVEHLTEEKELLMVAEPRAEYQKQNSIK